MVIGIGAGVALHNIGVGLAIGTAIGVAIEAEFRRERGNDQ